MKLVPVICTNGIGAYSGKSLPVKTVYGSPMLEVGSFFGVEVGGQYLVLYDRIEGLSKTLKAVKTIGGDTYTLEVDVDTCGQVIEMEFYKSSPPVPDPNKMRIVVYEREVRWDENLGAPVTIDREVAEFTARYLTGDNPGFYSPVQRVKKYKNYMELTAAYFTPSLNTAFRHLVKVGFGYFYIRDAAPVWKAGEIYIYSGSLFGNSVIDDNPYASPWSSVLDESPNDNLWYPFYIGKGARADIFTVNN